MCVLINDNDILSKGQSDVGDMGILIRQATKDGYIAIPIGGVCDLSYENSSTRRGRVQGGVI